MAAKVGVAALGSIGLAGGTCAQEQEEKERQRIVAGGTKRGRGGVGT